MTHSLKHFAVGLAAVMLGLGCLSAAVLGEPGKKNATAEKSDKADKKAAGNKSAKQVKQAENKRAEKKGRASAEEQETAALTLVRNQHPELSELLEQLKADNPEQYRQAISELFRASQRLAQAKEKDPQRYELELKAWRIDSRVRLLAAKLTMETRPELEEKLKASLLEREDVRIELLSLDRERAAERLEKLDGQLTRLRERREKLSDRAFDQLMRRLKSGSKAKGAKAARQAAKSKASEKEAAPKKEAEAKQPAGNE
ncbi:MAG TPA: hypothetical protein VHC19_14720 [Pirellulales bacterium]|nr:hypothetical protein [Pirellulales bacterium]